MTEYEIILKNILFPKWILYVLSASILILAVVNYKREIISLHMKNILLNPIHSYSFAREDTNFLGKVNWLLVINYIIVSSLAIKMLFIEIDSLPFYILFLPSFYYLAQTISLYTIGFLSADFKRIASNVLLSRLTAHALGILLIPILIIWILNPQYSQLFIKIVLAIFFIANTLRIFRGIFAALNNKVAWYYIILYLCTFEIWALLLIFQVLYPNLKG